MRPQSTDAMRDKGLEGALTLPSNAHVLDGLTVEVHQGPAALPAIEAEWRALEARVADADFFTSADWASAWHRHGLDGYEGMSFITVRRDEKLLALLPLTILRTGPARSGAIVGTGSGFYSDMLADFGTTVGKKSILRALWSGIDQLGVDTISFEAVREGSRLDALLGERGTTVAGPVNPSVEVCLSGYPTIDAYMATRSSNLRQNLRRRRRKLASTGAVAYQVITDEKQIPDVIARIVALKLEWLSDKGLHGRFLARPNIVPWLTDLAVSASRSGRLHLSVLTVGDVIVAAQLGFQSNNRVTAYIGAFDQAYAAYAVGKLHLEDHLADLAATGTSLDLMPPDDDYKLEWGTPGPGIRTHVVALSPAGQVLALAQSPYLRATAKKLYLAIPKHARAETASVVAAAIASAKKIIRTAVYTVPPVLHQSPALIALA